MDKTQATKYSEVERSEVERIADFVMGHLSIPTSDPLMQREYLSEYLRKEIIAAEVRGFDRALKQANNIMEQL